MRSFKPSFDAGAAQRVAPVKEIDSLCPYCGVGCALTYAVDQDSNDILFTRGRDGASNAGRLCVKGRYGFDYSMHAQRLTKPLIRKDSSYPRGPLSHFSKAGNTGRRKPGGIVDYDEVLPHFREATWEEALERAAEGLKRIRDDHGPEAMSGFGSAKGSNEEAYLVQKMVRAAFGTNNIDHCTRLCHASSVFALMECIGSGAVTNVVRDIENAEVALIVGCNPTANHPVAATFMKEAAARGTKLLVANIRRPGLADYADQYLQMKPGTDVAFFNGLMHVIIEEGLYDREYVENRTEGFDDLAAEVKRWTPEVAAKYTGLPADEIARFARTLGKAKSAMFFWGMGISQHTFGTDNARCLISLALITGNIGKPGTGLHPLRGQNNVQGASDVGLIPMYFPDYKSVADPEIHAWYEKFWDTKLSNQPGKTVVEITTSAWHGDIKAMYCMGENPFLSDPDTTKVREALARLEFLVVQDIFLTETAEFADVILPASSFMEKTGTYTNTDRRVQIGRPARDLPGEARQDWEIICEVSTRMGYPMHYDNVSQIFDEMVECMPNYANLSYEVLGDYGKWYPYKEPGSEGTKIMFGDTFPRGRGLLKPADISQPYDMVDDEYRYVLATGRTLEHWHTGVMTRRSKALDTLSPVAYVEVHPDDAAELGVSERDYLSVRSRRGHVVVETRISTDVSPGSIFIPMHFREAGINELTAPEIDPDGKIPDFKFVAVKMARAEAGAAESPVEALERLEAEEVDDE